MLFEKREIEKFDLIRQKRYWNKQLKSPKGKYSDFWCRKQIEEIEKKLNELKGGKIYGN